MSDVKTTGNNKNKHVEIPLIQITSRALSTFLLVNWCVFSFM